VPSVASPSIGPKLRQARLDRALSIEETAWRTRIRPDLLRALEDEEFESIGHHGFVRSHLSSYARFLGMDVQELCEEFESTQDEAPASPIEELDRKAKVAPKQRRPKWLIAAVLSGGALVTAAAVGQLGGQTERPAAHSNVLAKQTTRPAAKAPAAPALTPKTAKVVLQIEALGSTRVSVIADGKEVFDGLLDPSQTKQFLARRTIDIVAADGGMVRLTLNGASMGTAGPSGAVFRARYGPHGVVNGA
jgi:cytoskeleton protein RodZ